jgi:hypothetical protein
MLLLKNMSFLLVAGHVIFTVIRSSEESSTVNKFFSNKKEKSLRIYKRIIAKQP